MFELLTMAPTLLAEVVLDDRAFGLLGGLLGTGLIIVMQYGLSENR